MEWLMRLLGVCSDAAEAPVDWVSACVVPLYKGMGIDMIAQVLGYKSITVHEVGNVQG